MPTLTVEGGMMEQHRRTGTGESAARSRQPTALEDEGQCPGVPQTEFSRLMGSCQKGKHKDQ